MSVLLAIATFATFILLDYLVRARRAARQVRTVGEGASYRSPLAAPIAPWPAVEPVWVAGYQLPDDFTYHSGHTWARQVGPDTVVVGIDDFAGKLIGAPEEVRLPTPGTRVRQGGKSFGVGVNGRSADLLAPVDGEVVEINPALRAKPSLLTDEPYGRGWVLKLRSSSLATDLKNLLSGSLARRWIEDARERLEFQLMALSGSVLQDGGEPVSDFARHLDADDWRRLVGEFLLC